MVSYELLIVFFATILKCISIYFVLRPNNLAAKKIASKSSCDYKCLTPVCVVQLLMFILRSAFQFRTSNGVSISQMLSSDKRRLLSSFSNMVCCRYAIVTACPRCCWPKLQLILPRKR